MKTIRKVTLAEKILGYIIGIPIIALLMFWENHVWAQLVISYSQFLAIAASTSFIIAIATKTNFWSALKIPLQILFLGSVFGQVLAWVGLIRLPFFH